jgi:hypothetical protein
MAVIKVTQKHATAASVIGAGFALSTLLVSDRIARISTLAIGALEGVVMK